MHRLEGKAAIVTGASRGIGAAIARALASEGAAVVLTARSSEALEKQAGSMQKEGLNASALPADVTAEKDVARLVERAVHEHGQVDILVNNAGIGYFKPVVELSTEEFDAMWNVNMRGVFLATRAVLPGMMKRGSGAIVNIASLAGKNGVKNGAAYAATKWALRGFAASLMLEVREYNIRVATIFPGSVNTAFSGANSQRTNYPQPEDVAEAVVFAVTVPQRSMISEIDLRPTRP